MWPPLNCLSHPKGWGRDLGVFPLFSTPILTYNGVKQALGVAPRWRRRSFPRAADQRNRD